MLRSWILAILSLFMVSLLWADPQPTVAPSTNTGVTATQSGPAFDVKAATDAYLATVPADKRARSDAYFEGGYWLELWDFLLGVAISIFLLQSRLSARLRDWAARISSWRGVRDLIYFILFLAITTALQFPLAVYEGYIREHKYGLATQTSAPGCAICWWHSG